MQYRGVKISRSVAARNAPNGDSKVGNFPRRDGNEGKIPQRQWRGPERGILGNGNSMGTENSREMRMRTKIPPQWGMRRRRGEILRAGTGSGKAFPQGSENWTGHRTVQITG
ncbi:hypothetical protein PIB30_041660 [Stylosanthes scabra]|uniref:Uncharacterized protein n=1 Tax=Stylosanthes scabra TaxID=79078 RepID=A0ABU6QF16_9FABA|nr:hypothetical protein [Stylosanthes scabra]